LENVFEKYTPIKCVKEGLKRTCKHSTFLDETPLHMPGFQCLYNPRPVFDMSSIRTAMKHSGGVVVFVNDSWSNCVSL